jgi:CheY-like chemotaxis protein
MATTPQNSTSRQVLFVDDDPDFLQLVRETFSALSKGHWQIHCAGSADAALDLLKRQKMDLVVVDANMPVLDGVQFLGLLGKRFSDVKKVSLTSFADEEHRTACLAAGAELFIEKPRSDGGYKSVHAMLDDLMEWSPQQGFQGMLRRVGLQDVIQMECLGRNSSVLEVYNEHVMGRIYIEEGNIIHAAGGDLTGERALQRLLSLPGGSFELVPFEPPPQRSITGPWEFLLMEAARMRDEMAARTPSDEPQVDPQTLAAPVAATVQLVETVVFSGFGKVLYEAGCNDVPGRVLLLKNIGRRAANLAQTVSLGDFDRVELQFPGGRAIAQAKPDRLVYVEVANVTTPP